MGAFPGRRQRNRDDRNLRERQGSRSRSAQCRAASFASAFVSKDIAADVARLSAAGATLVSGPETAANGDGLAMLRDPWGVCLQLVKRTQPMI